jgi:thiamine kinase-like enzyme
MTIDEVIAGVPAWAGRDVRAESIDGGLTNANYRLVVGDEQFCVRIPGRDSSLLAVDRREEHLNTLAAAEAGVGAQVRYTVGDEPVMVLEWITGEVQTEESLHRAGAVEQIAASVKRLHAGPRFANAFDMFTIQPRYRGICAEHGFKIPDDYDDHAAVVRRIEQAMAVQGANLVPCNNDLLAANFVDDGQKIWLIDYEYSGNNDPCFELGNIWRDNGLSLDQLEGLVTAYYGRTTRHELARARLQGTVSQYGWTLWGCIQHGSSTLDFDFWEWGMQRYENAVEEFRGPDFGRLLDAAGYGHRDMGEMSS